MFLQNTHFHLCRESDPFVFNMDKSKIWSLQHTGNDPMYFQVASMCMMIVIDSATYLLTISSPDINKVAMSLYDIINRAEQAKVRPAYKLKNCRERLARYSNHLTFLTMHPLNITQHHWPVFAI